MGPFHWELTASRHSALRFQRTIFDDGQSADEKELRAVIERSFVEDTSWGDAIHEVNSMLDGWLERAFEPEKRGSASHATWPAHDWRRDLVSRSGGGK